MLELSPFGILPSHLHQQYTYIRQARKHANKQPKLLFAYLFIDHCLLVEHPDKHAAPTFSDRYQSTIFDLLFCSTVARLPTEVSPPNASPPL
jgi:hypothetical protein